MKRQKVLSLVLLLVEVVFTVFIAGIVVPSFLRSDLATNKALAMGSLHTIIITGIALPYTTQNVEFAILGALVGAMAAFAIPFRATTPKNTALTITLRAAASETEPALGPLGGPVVSPHLWTLPNRTTRSVVTRTAGEKHRTGSSA